MEILAKHIEESLEEREFCLVFAGELERCWPAGEIESDEREEQIQAFAKSHGWSVSIVDIDDGFRAIFRRSD